MTTLDELKRRVALYESLSETYKLTGEAPHALDHARAEAWRAAFEWRESCLDRVCHPDEYAEGMRLIREKLS